MKVLVTGASGFVGGGLTRRLGSEPGISVRCTVRRETPQLPSKTEVVRVADLAPFTDWTGAVKGVDVVVHTAGRVHIMHDTSASPLTEFRRANVGGTLALARQAADAGVQRFVFISSIGVNGAETFDIPFTAEDKPAPSSPYSLSKYEAEVGLRLIAQATGLQVVIIRPPLVFGPDAPGNFRRLLELVYLGLPLPFGAIHNARSLVSLDNLVDLLVCCTYHIAAPNETFLVSDGEDISTTALLRRIAAAMDRPARLLPLSATVLRRGANLIGRADLGAQLFGSCQVNITKTREKLGWRPLVSLGDALERAVRRFASIDPMSALVSPVNFGSAAITATVGGKSGQRNVNYTFDASFSLVILPDTSVMLVGTSRKLRVQRTDGFNRGSIVVPGPRWWTSDPAVAQVVESTGEISIIAEGHATITAEVAGRQFTAEVFGFRYPAPLTFSSFSSGTAHACAITPSGVAYCWGLNDQGQLGNAAMMEKCLRFATVGALFLPFKSHRCSQVPVAVATPARFASISAGGRTTCALTSAGAAYCWGRNVAGMTGTGATDTIVTTPLPVQGGISFRSIDVGTDQVCGVSTADEAYCWGANSTGALGNGTTTSNAVPTRVLGTQSWSMVRAGATTCGITTEGAGYCWGENDWEQAGAAAGTQGCTTMSPRICPTPVRVSTSLTFTHIGSGGDLSCGLATTRTAYCWGFKGTAGETSSVPVAVSGGPFTSLDAHGVCAVDVNGSVYCWGSYPNSVTRTLPTFPVTALSVGNGHFSLRCATDANSILWCWDNQSFFDFMWWANEFAGVTIGSGTPLRVAGQP